MEIENISRVLKKVREKSPLIHNLTNVVVTNFTANGLLALGASPVMAFAREEVADMARIADALVINMGTLTADTVESMLLAGKSANNHQVPIIFDPVGVGATPYRSNVGKKIINELEISIIRANTSEIANLIGVPSLIKGVDSSVNDLDRITIAKQAAQKLSAVIVMTGEEDIISDGKRTYIIQNGHQLQTKVTGMGCLLSSVVGAFAAVHTSLLEAAIAAVVTYGISAELAYNGIREKTPGSFQIEFLNQLFKVSNEEIEGFGAYKCINKEENNDDF